MRDSGESKKEREKFSSFLDLLTIVSRNERRRDEIKKSRGSGIGSGMRKCNKKKISNKHKRNEMKKLTNISLAF